MENKVQNDLNLHLCMSLLHGIAHRIAAKESSTNTISVPVLPNGPVSWDDVYTMHNWMVDHMTLNSALTKGKTESVISEAGGDEAEDSNVETDPKAVNGNLDDLEHEGTWGAPYEEDGYEASTNSQISHDNTKYTPPEEGDNEDLYLFWGPYFKENFIYDCQYKFAEDSDFAQKVADLAIGALAQHRVKNLVDNEVKAKFDETIKQLATEKLDEVLRQVSGLNVQEPRVKYRRERDRGAHSPSTLTDSTYDGSSSRAGW